MNGVDISILAICMSKKFTLRYVRHSHTILIVFLNS